mmetsp:Transcript_8714/g.12386  ORF Transcript_8714/g.12386 Transcript_8714/m.12386 type:complete len:275 (+) Transcript_8714:30-854(+)
MTFQVHTKKSSIPTNILMTNSKNNCNKNHNVKIKNNGCVKNCKSKRTSPTLFLKILFLVTVFLQLPNGILSSNNVNNSEDTNDSDSKGALASFINACAGGKFNDVKNLLQKYPHLAKAETKDGETCLHLTAISKSLDISKLVIEYGADVNKRTTHDKGQRMMPLSWHVWAGDIDIVKLLLDNGADINADFDFSHETDSKVTVTDISDLIIDGRDPNHATQEEPKDEDDPFALHQLLLDLGGKTYQQLHPDSPYILSKDKSKATPEEEEDAMRDL